MVRSKRSTVKKNVPTESNNLRLIKPKTINQKHYVKEIIHNDVTICTGPSGCVDADTEFLSQSGWKKISEYVDTDLVMQFNPANRFGSLVKPTNFIKLPSDGFFKIKTKYGVDQVLSKEHKFVYESSKGNINFKIVEQLVREHEKSKYGFGGKILTSYEYDGIPTELSENQIRLQVAIKADGSVIKTKTGTKYRINLKKDRKKERLNWLLRENNIEYTLSVKNNGYSVYCFYYDCSKFLSDWMFCSREDASIICDELKHWDGKFSPSGNRMSSFSTTVKEDADTVQYLYNILGYKASISIDNRVGDPMSSGYIRKNICYTVNPTEINKIGITSNKKIEFDFLRPQNGEYKYCFEVPSGCLVLRRNNNVFITGNSGKSLVALSTALDHVMRSDKPQSRIYITRPMIATSERDFPYIKGNLIEKLTPYFAPILANLTELIGSKWELEKMLENETIVMQAIELMRGFTYKNCFVLITESQNMSISQAVMAITRLGENCKMIFEGDTDQKDLYGPDGLTFLRDKLYESSDLCGMVEMGEEDILRHPLIGQILKKLDYKGKAAY